MRDISFSAAKKPQKCSSTWSAMLSVRDQLKEGCIWLIGTEAKIRVWNDPWVLGLPCYTPTVATQTNQHIKFVKEFLNSEGTDWNTDMVRQHFDPYEAEHILKTYINKTESDRLIWIYTPHGDFSAQSYQKLLKVNSDEEAEIYTPPFNQLSTDTTRSQEWCPPPADTIKINVDATWKSSTSSCAAVVRNARGQFICAQTEIANIRIPLTAEAS